MSLFFWSRLWQRSSVPSGRRRPPRYRPRLKQLENRELLSTFTVVLATDSGGAAGQMVTATSGDMRYCIEQADAAHSAASDVIDFDPTLFATPQTIALNSGNGPLILTDSHPLTIQGPTTGTGTVSGGDAIQMLDIQSGNVTISHLAFSHGATSGNGAGISNSGTLTLTNCGFDHDAASGGGGLFNASNTASAKLVSCTFNHDTAADGGGIYAFGKLTLTKCTFSNDVSTGVGGGGLWVSLGCKATVTSCTFDNDTTTEDGGGVFVYKTSTATFTSCTLSNDSADNGGGGLCTDGVCTVKMTRCTISNGTAMQGGGVCNSGGTVTLVQCTVDHNSASGFLNEGTATVTACTFSNNTAAAGGGMENLGPATVTNCTFSNNATTVGNGVGGALYVGRSGGVGSTLTMTNCTIANNAATHGSGGGICIDSSSTLNLINTIVAENTAAASGPDIYGSINTADHNLIGDIGGGTIVTDQGGNLMGGNGSPVIDPRLGPLASHGGPTQTLALLADSLAIGHADDAFAPATDQRGHARSDHFGLATDIGAYEYP